MTTIELARPDDWPAALDLALARIPADERPQRVRHCIQLFEDGVFDASGIWVARRDHTIVGVQVCVPMPGAVCFFWLPIAEQVEALLEAGLRKCRTEGCKIAQTLVSTDQLAEAEPLLRAGFRHLGRMYVLEHNLEDVPEESSLALRYQPLTLSNAETFTRTLERTYVGSLDCPELNGKRTMDEILAGHRGQGTFHPECWWLVFEADRPIGVVLIAEIPTGMSWELMYLGLVPEARRRGHGRAMTLRALHWLRDQPATHLTLSVDGRNLPARQLYQSLGFTEVESHEVLLRFFGSDDVARWK